MGRVRGFNNRPKFFKTTVVVFFANFTIFLNYVGSRVFLNNTTSITTKIAHNLTHGMFIKLFFLEVVFAQNTTSQLFPRKR